MFDWWFRIKFWKARGRGLRAGARWRDGSSGRIREYLVQPVGGSVRHADQNDRGALGVFAVINAVASLSGQKSIAALAGRTFLWFALTAILAVGVGLLFGWLIQPGAGVGTLKIASDYSPKDVPSALDMLMNLVPANPLPSLGWCGKRGIGDGTKVLVPRNGTVLQVIFFAGLVGFAMVKLGEKVAGVRKLVGEASEVMIQVTRYVLEFTPLGTFGLIAALVGGYEFDQLRPLLMFVVALRRLRVPYGSCLQQFVAAARA